MESPLVRWLLDIDRIAPDAEGVRLAWEHPLPVWVWLLIAAAMAGFAFWSYSRLAGVLLGRRLLATARTLLLIVLAVILCGPLLELPRETVEEDWVMVLADRSESLTIADAGGESLLDRRSRDRQLRDMLRDSASTWRDLDDKRELVWLGFHDSAFDLDTIRVDADPSEMDANALVHLGDPIGRRTRINRALEQALQQAAARPLAGIILFSDGRSDDPPARSLMRRLRAEQIRVYTVPLGSDRPLGDLAVRRVDAPRRAFVRDKVPIIVELDRFGEAVRDMGATAELIDEATGEVLDSITIEPGDERDEVTLTADPQLAGNATWVVRIDTDRVDLIPENNAQSFPIELIDRPLRVLYIEGYPRWEYQFLKSLLIREKSVESSIMLLSADRDFAQEGNAPLSRLPRSPEEFAEFDVIILGDVPGGFFSPSQLEMMRDHVADRSAGFLWIGGMRSVPSSYTGASAVLADLLPFRGSLSLPRLDDPVNMVPTPLADRLGVLRLVSAGEIGWPIELADPVYRWSQVQWGQRILANQLKPTAQALAVTAEKIQGEQLPLVIHMRYGSGQVIYVATDEIWRWRYGRGDLLPEQFWVQMIRMLGRETISGGDDPATLEVEPRRVSVHQPMQIELRLQDARLVDLDLQRIRATLEDAEGATLAELELVRNSPDSDTYSTTYLPDVVGNLRVRVVDPLITPDALLADVLVQSPEDELRRPETDHALLAQLADQTGGRVLRADELDQLPQLLPNRSKTTPNPLTERLWDTPLAFILALLLITLEWIGRKVIRLM
ncbi:MAG: hypothetical protein ACR2GY_02235 [Phycisphaerales bacterium]